jgi:hypothetical protein
MNSGYVNSEHEAKENSIAEIHPFLGPSQDLKKKIEEANNISKS